MVGLANRAIRSVVDTLVSSSFHFFFSPPPFLFFTMVVHSSELSDSAMVSKDTRETSRANFLPRSGPFRLITILTLDEIRQNHSVRSSLFLNDAIISGSLGIAPRIMRINTSLVFDAWSTVQLCSDMHNERRMGVAMFLLSYVSLLV